MRIVTIHCNLYLQKCYKTRSKDNTIILCTQYEEKEEEKCARKIYTINFLSFHSYTVNVNTLPILTYVDKENTLVKILCLSFSCERAHTHS